MTSWGVLLNEAQNLAAVQLYPWLLLPVLPVLVTVLAFNFMGDGLRTRRIRITSGRYRVWNADPIHASSAGAGD